MKQPTSKTHILFTSGIGMFLIGGVFPVLVVHKTEHLKIGGTFELMKCGPRNWQCLELRTPWEM